MGGEVTTRYVKVPFYTHVIPTCIPEQHLSSIRLWETHYQVRECAQEQGLRGAKGQTRPSASFLLRLWTVLKGVRHEKGLGLPQQLLQERRRRPHTPATRHCSNMGAAETALYNSVEADPCYCLSDPCY